MQMSDTIKISEQTKPSDKVKTSWSQQSCVVALDFSIQSEMMFITSTQDLVITQR